jgi:hypothetical protein
MQGAFQEELQGEAPQQQEGLWHIFSPHMCLVRLNTVDFDIS